MKQIARACSILFCLVISVTAKPDVPRNPIRTPAVDFSEIDKLVPEELKEKNTPGAVITVISGDQVVYQKAFGVASVETNAPMQPEMLFGSARQRRCLLPPHSSHSPNKTRSS